MAIVRSSCGDDGNSRIVFYFNAAATDVLWIRQTHIYIYIYTEVDRSRSGSLWNIPLFRLSCRLLATLCRRCHSDKGAAVTQEEFDLKSRWLEIHHVIGEVGCQGVEWKMMIQKDFFSSEASSSSPFSCHDIDVIEWGWIRVELQVQFIVRNFRWQLCTWWY